jgi:hypothetical protein
MSDQLGELVRAIVGCEWGRGIAIADDLEPCEDIAVAIVVLHRGDEECDFKLCEKHRQRVLEVTEPHV